MTYISDFKLGKDRPTETLNQHRTQITETVYITQSTNAPTEPLGDVIRHYTNTLCSAQKQINLTNSLLQDIPVFKGHDTTHLEGLARGHRDCS